MDLDLKVMFWIPIVGISLIMGVILYGWAENVKKGTMKEYPIRIETKVSNSQNKVNYVVVNK